MHVVQPQHRCYGPLIPRGSLLTNSQEPVLAGFAQVSLALRFKNLPNNVSIQHNKSIPQCHNK